MIKILNLLMIMTLVMFLSISLANAHDSHSHQAPWQACADKQKSQDCSYKNGAGDLFKGSCQLFSEALLCVRNKPIIYAIKPVEMTKNKDTQENVTAHSHP